jgi:hypothetical protein
MSVCQFDLPFSQSPREAVQKARAAVESQNGIFQGDENSGHFEVSVMGNTVKGNYAVSGQILHLSITDKPIFVPCSMMESFLRKEIS